MVFQYIFYGEKQVIQQKQSVLSKLKGTMHTIKHGA